MATSVERVQAQTPNEVNARIQQQMRMRLAYYEQHRDEIDERLAELDSEWDIERAIETNASTLALTGTIMGLIRGRWFILPLGVLGFLLQHSIQGWCPPVPILRRFGFRTEHEIDIERNALRALRGDFDEVSRGTPFDGIVAAFKPLPAYRGRVSHEPQESQPSQEAQQSQETQETQESQPDPAREAPHESAHQEEAHRADVSASEEHEEQEHERPEQHVHHG